MFTAVSIVTILLVASRAAAQDCALNFPAAVTNCFPDLAAVSFNRPFLHKDFGCPEACLMAAPSGCSVFQLYLNSRK